MRAPRVARMPHCPVLHVPVKFEIQAFQNYNQILLHSASSDCRNFSGSSNINSLISRQITFDYMRYFWFKGGGTWKVKTKKKKKHEELRSSELSYKEQITTLKD